jgi:hypothetical protein
MVDSNFNKKFALLNNKTSNKTGITYYPTSKQLLEDSNILAMLVTANRNSD